MGKRLNEQFAKEKIQKATWLSLVTKKIQIKITLKYHYIPTRMALLKKTESSRSWQGWGETGILIHFWWECKTPKKTRQKNQIPLNSYSLIVSECINTDLSLNPAFILLEDYIYVIQRLVHRCSEQHYSNTESSPNVQQVVN